MRHSVDSQRVFDDALMRYVLANHWSECSYWRRMLGPAQWQVNAGSESSVGSIGFGALPKMIDNDQKRWKDSVRKWRMKETRRG